MGGRIPNNGLKKSKRSRQKKIDNKKKQQHYKQKARMFPSWLTEEASVWDSSPARSQEFVTADGAERPPRERLQSETTHPTVTNLPSFSPKKRGWPKGKPHGAMPESVRLAISDGQKRRWADEKRRGIAIVGCLWSWKTGGRSKDKVVWTPEMDDKLRELRAREKFIVFRRMAPAAIGVSEGLVMRRLRDLGLTDPVISSRSKDALEARLHRMRSLMATEQRSVQSDQVSNTV